MDDLVHVDEHVVALARTLSSCFVVRGAQLSVIKRLESEHVVEVHTSSISWIVKRIATYENSKNFTHLSLPLESDPKTNQ
jgi:cohesin complex subunit SA-1/2